MVLQGLDNSHSLRFSLAHTESLNRQHSCDRGMGCPPWQVELAKREGWNFFFFWRGFNLCKTTCVVIRQRGKFDVKISLFSVVSRRQQMEQSRRTRVLGRAADGTFDASWLELQSGSFWAAQGRESWCSLGGYAEFCSVGFVHKF